MVWLLHLGVLGAMDFCHFFLIEGDKGESRVIKALYASMILNGFLWCQNDPRLSSVSCMIFHGFLGQNHVESFLVVQV